MAVLGIDVGSSEVKAALFDDEGACLATASAEYRISSPQPGWAELDHRLLWEVVTRVIREVQAQPSAEAVGALAFSNHGESFVPLDAAGQPLSPFILNIDGRATAEMDDFVAAFGRERLYRSTGLPPHPSYTLAKIAWLQKHRSEICDKAARFLCVQDYLLFRGTGEAWIDASTASRTMGYDIIQGCWDEELLAQAGLDPEKMASVMAGGVKAGKARPEVLRETGLPVDTLWVVGGHDQSCTSIGAGGLQAGRLVDVTGTFECISIATREQLSTAAVDFNLPCERHTVRGRFLSLAYAPGGIVLRWFRDQFGRDVLAKTGPGSSCYEALLASMPDQPTGIFVLPYLFGTGTPWLDSSARGLIHGFSFETSRETLVRSALEGVTYEMRWNLEALERLGVSADRIVAVGGGAKSPAWLQLKADIFGREVTAIPGEAGCRGAAICAGVGCGLYSTFEQGIASSVHRGPAFEPRADAHRRYTEAFGEYKRLAKQLYGYEIPLTGRHIHAIGS